MQQWFPSKYGNTMKIIINSWNSTGEIGRIGPKHIVTSTSGFSTRCRPMRPIFPVKDSSRKNSPIRHYLRNTCLCSTNEILMRVTRDFPGLPMIIFEEQHIFLFIVTMVTGEMINFFSVICLHQWSPTFFVATLNWPPTVPPDPEAYDTI